MADIKLGAVPQVRAAGLRTSAPGHWGNGVTPDTAASTAQAGAAGAEALDAGQAPVDADRVSTIRKAIADGSYPVIPMRIGDAIIAAGILLRSSEA